MAHLKSLNKKQIIELTSHVKQYCEETKPETFCESILFNMQGVHSSLLTILFVKLIFYIDLNRCCSTDVWQPGCQSRHTDWCRFVVLSFLKTGEGCGGASWISLCRGGKQTRDSSLRTKAPFTEAVWSRNHVHIFNGMVMCKYVTCGRSWYYRNSDGVNSFLRKNEWSSSWFFPL